MKETKAQRDAMREYVESLRETGSNAEMRSRSLATLEAIVRDVNPSRDREYSESIRKLLSQAPRKSTSKESQLCADYKNKLRKAQRVKKEAEEEVIKFETKIKESEDQIYFEKRRIDAIILAAINCEPAGKALAKEIRQAGITLPNKTLANYDK